MKITAEFNSNEELLSFISTFGTKVVPEQSKGFNHIEASKTTVSTTKEKNVESKEGITKLPTEKVDAAPSQAEAEQGEVKEDKVTLEMIRAVFQKIIKAGKQKEAKEITAKYGAAKLPELKEEHFADVLKEAEALL